MYPPKRGTNALLVLVSTIMCLASLTGCGGRVTGIRAARPIVAWEHGQRKDLNGVVLRHNRPPMGGLTAILADEPPPADYRGSLDHLSRGLPPYRRVETLGRVADLWNVAQSGGSAAHQVWVLGTDPLILGAGPRLGTTPHAGDDGCPSDSSPTTLLPLIETCHLNRQIVTIAAFPDGAWPALERAGTPGQVVRLARQTIRLPQPTTLRQVLAEHPWTGGR